MSRPEDNNNSNQNIRNEEKLRAATPERLKEKKSQEQILKELEKIRKAARGREGTRTPKARFDRKQKLRDDSRNNLQITKRLKTFVGTIGDDMRSSTVETIGGILSSIPGAKSLGGALGAATEGTKLKSVFSRHVLGKDSGNNGSGSNTFDSMSDGISTNVETNLEQSKDLGSILEVLNSILDNVSFIKNQLPSKLDLKEDKNERKMLSRRGIGGLGGGRGRGRGTDSDGLPGPGGKPGAGGITSWIDTFTEVGVGAVILQSLARRLGITKLLTSVRTLLPSIFAARTAAAAVGGVAPVAAGMAAGFGGVPSAARGATNLLPEAVQAVRARNLLPAAASATQQATRVAATMGSDAVAASRFIEMANLGKNAAGVTQYGIKATEVAKTAQLAKMMNSLKAMRLAMAATTPLRAVGSVTTMGLTEVGVQLALSGIESNMNTAIAHAVSHGSMVQERKAIVDPTTGRVRTVTVDKATQQVIRDEQQDRLGFAGQEPKTRLQETKNKTQVIAVRELQVNEDHIIQVLKAAVEAFEQGDDQMATGLMTEAKNAMIRRAEIAGRTGFDTASLKKLIQFTPKGDETMSDLLTKAGGTLNVWETRDQDWIDDTRDQLVEIMGRSESEGLYDPSDVTSMAELQARASKKASGQQRLWEASQQGNLSLIKQLQDPNTMLNLTEEGKEAAIEALGKETYDRMLLQAQQHHTLGMGQASELPIAQSSATLASSAASRNNQTQTAIVSNISPVTQVNNNSSVANNTFRGGDNSMSEPAFINRKNEQRRSTLFA